MYIILSCMYCVYIYGCVRACMLVVAYEIQSRCPNSVISLFVYQIGCGYQHVDYICTKLTGAISKYATCLISDCPGLSACTNGHALCVV